jgi:bifunctional DNase/RNase
MYSTESAEDKSSFVQTLERLLDEKVAAGIVLDEVSTAWGVIRWLEMGNKMDPAMERCLKGYEIKESEDSTEPSVSLKLDFVQEVIGGVRGEVRIFDVRTEVKFDNRFMAECLVERIRSMGVDGSSVTR